MKPVEIRQGETWLEVEGFPGYLVSNQGRVATLWRKWGAGFGGTIRTVLGNTPRLLKQQLTRRYFRVCLYTGGRPKSVMVHHLVLLHFVGSRPFLRAQGLHRDDDPSNNTVANLYWGSNSDNAKDRVRNGRPGGALPGSKHHNAKLHEKDIPVILRRLARGDNQDEIAAAYGVSRRAIKRVKLGIGWTHVKANREGLPKKGRQRQVLRKNSTSGFVGVNWNKQSGRWMARVMKDGQSFYLGLFQTAEEAARAVNKAYRKHFPRLPQPNPTVV